MENESSERIAIVFNGFLALSMKEKVRLVDTLNNFFDHTGLREGLRAENEEKVRGLVKSDLHLVCGCCRRPFGPEHDE